MVMPDLIDLESFTKEKYKQVAKTYHQLGLVSSEILATAKSQNMFVHISALYALLL